MTTDAVTGAQLGDRMREMTLSLGRVMVRPLAPSFTVAYCYLQCILIVYSLHSL